MCKHEDTGESNTELRPSSHLSKHLRHLSTRQRTAYAAFPFSFDQLLLSVSSRYLLYVHEYPPHQNNYHQSRLSLNKSGLEEREF